jgi:hypothetical protein
MISPLGTDLSIAELPLELRDLLSLVSILHQTRRSAGNLQTQAADVRLIAINAS